MFPFVDRRHAEGEVRRGTRGEAEAQERPAHAAAQVPPVQAAQRHRPGLPRHLARLLRAGREARQSGNQGTRMRPGMYSPRQFPRARAISKMPGLICFQSDNQFKHQTYHMKEKIFK